MMDALSELVDSFERILLGSLLLILAYLIIKIKCRQKWPGGRKNPSKNSLPDCELTIVLSSKPQPSVAYILAAFNCNETSSDSLLLNLPGELRNRIYQHALLTDDPNNSIEISAQGYDTSALLGACRKLRRETWGIFYCEKFFTVPVRDYNSDLICAWRCHFERLGLSGLRVDWQPRILDSPTPNWANLYTWARRVHEDAALFCPLSPETLSDETMADAGLYRLALEAQLAGGVLKIAIGMTDGRWCDEIESSLSSSVPCSRLWIVDGIKTRARDYSVTQGNERELIEQKASTS